MQRVPLVPFQGMLWPSCPCATCLPARPPAFAGSCPCERACPDQHLLLSLPALGQGRDVPSSQTLPALSREPSTAFPFWGFSSSAKWVQLPPSLVLLPAPACPHHRCLHPAAEPCSLPLDEGDCQHYTLRWYYNQRVTECRPFVYSGCRGNLNRFDSKEECELHCGQHPGAGRHGTGRSGSIPTWCRELGRCRAGGDDAGPPPQL